MKLWRMFLLHFEEAFLYRSISVVWFLLTAVNVVLYLLFWNGAFRHQSVIGTYTLSDISSYYFVLIVAGALLTSHIEEDVAHWDIKEGGLVKFLVRPMSYIGFKFFDEIPWRIIQGVLGLLTLVLIRMFWGPILTIHQDGTGLLLAMFISICAYLMSFLFKMIIGIIAFWIIDYSGTLQLVEVIVLLCAGYIMPLEYFPAGFQQVSRVLPFIYMIYYPVVAWLGRLAVADMWQILGTQIVWIAVLSVIYRTLWKSGLRRFTGEGQ